MYGYIYINIHRYTDMWICFKFLCVYVCMWVCMCVCMCVHIIQTLFKTVKICKLYISISRQTDTHTHIYIHVCVWGWGACIYLFKFIYVPRYKFEKFSVNWWRKCNWLKLEDVQNVINLLRNKLECLCWKEISAM